MCTAIPWRMCYAPSTSRDSGLKSSVRSFNSSTPQEVLHPWLERWLRIRPMTLNQSHHDLLETLEQINTCRMMHVTQQMSSLLKMRDVSLRMKTIPQKAEQWCIWCRVWWHHWAVGSSITWHLELPWPFQLLIHKSITSFYCLSQCEL